MIDSGETTVWSFSRMVILPLLLTITTSAYCADSDGDVGTLLEDGFNALKSGLLFDVVGAHTEYHYLPQVAPKGNWAVSSFKSVESQRAWRVISENGSNVMLQASRTRKNSHTHPMIVAGDPLWDNYTVTVHFAPDSQAVSQLLFGTRSISPFHTLQY